MNGFMNQIHIEGGRTLDQREQKSLVERHYVKREKSEQQETRKDPFVAESSSRRYHKCLRLLSTMLFNFNAAVLQARLLMRAALKREPLRARSISLYLEDHPTCPQGAYSIGQGLPCNSTSL
jgi:hypothetical protein